MIIEEFAVYIEDMEGHVVHDEIMQSHSNGFIDLWLPRDQKYLIIIEHNDMKVEKEISTFENDATCITTMQLM